MKSTHSDPAQAKAPVRRTPLRGALGTLALIVCLALAAIMLLPALLGYQRYVITGGSMTGTIDRGSIAFDKPVPVEQLRIGDVITYRPPGAAPGHRVTHRIVAIRRARGNRLEFRTKGDANRSPDPWRFVLRGPTQARVAFHVPYAGYALSALMDRDTRMLVIGLPALVLALSLLVGLWRQAGEEAHRSRNGSHDARGEVVTE
jgi:signal peptidase I